MSDKLTVFIASMVLAGLLGCDDATTSSSSTGGEGGTSSTGGGGIGGDGGEGGEGGVTYIPTSQDINFTPIAPIPRGEQILFNDWSSPDRLLSMQPDGSNAIEIFNVYRIWSVGVARGGDKLAFSVGDSGQEEHYGVTFTDSIQHTFIYDFDTQMAEVAAYGNINDECHHWGPGDATLYLCRRQNFTADGMNETYRLGAIDLASDSFSFLVDAEAPNVLTLNPRVTNDGSEMYFTRIEIMGTQQQRAIGKIALPDGTMEVVRGNAYQPVLSPDGTRYLYLDSAQNALYESDLDGGNAVLVVDRRVTDATYSPDGSQVAFLLDDAAANCSMVHVAATDGSQSTDPPLVRNCADTGEFITALAWFVRP